MDGVDQERVSVVIPAFNAARWLNRTIASVLAQGSAVGQVIVVDDGSVDDTQQIAAGYPAVTAIRQENAGDAAARNTGLARARDTHVLFLDHDDMLLEGAVKAHLRVMRSDAAPVMTVGRVQRIDAQDQVIGETALTPRLFDYRDVALGLTPTFSQCLYRADALREIGGFDPGAKAAADHDLNIRLLRHGRRGSVHGALVAAYRLHDAQQTRRPARLWAMHEAVLRRLLSPDGTCADPTLLQRALAHWRGYYAPFIASSAAKAVVAGDIKGAASNLAAWLACGRQGVVPTLRFASARLARPR